MKTVTFSNEGHGNVGRLGSYLFINFFPEFWDYCCIQLLEMLEFFSVCYLNVDYVGVVKEKLRDTIESNF